MKRLIAGGSAALLLAGALVVAAVAPASATYEMTAEAPAPEVTAPAADTEVDALPVEDSAPVEDVTEEAPTEQESTPIEVKPEGKPEGNGHGHPELICDESGEGWQSKVDAKGDPATVAYTAPEGFLVDSYCVKAGKTKHIIEVSPASASVVIDHPVKDSVSHYQVHLIPVVVTEPELPTPVACVAGGDWYSEDGANVRLQPGGAVFVATGGKPGIDYRVATSGNLQGWTSASYVATGSDQLFFRMTISSEQGGFGYKSLSFPGYTTIDQNSIASQTGKTIAEMAALWPDNQITSVGFSMNSGAPEGTRAILKSFTSDCGSVDFVHVKPEIPAPTVTTTYTDWAGGEPDCDNQEVTQTRTISTTTVTHDWKWEGGAWVLVSETSQSGSDEERVVKYEGDDCEVVTPPTEEPKPAATTTPAPVKAAVASDKDTLATTGGSADWGLLAGAGGFLLAGAGLFFGARRLARR